MNSIRFVLTLPSSSCVACVIRSQLSVQLVHPYSEHICPSRWWSPSWSFRISWDPHQSSFCLPIVFLLIVVHRCFAFETCSSGSRRRDIRRRSELRSPA
ncbi:hypothetical protein Y032_0136g1947 [Ancylostoma ceylanicum]|uniref:Uncharacterized protein n=1 Tax=Ancylostoma ceylanicum TaxID=53326 RepID=A0A016T526_9BILA|nr:hypothetical protein Y032_0136g1947 [Ancylostoma ceylanicum]